MARRRSKRQHGTGEVYESSPGSWACRWRENGRRRFRAGFPDRETAATVLAKVRGDVALQRAGMPADARGLPTLAVLADEWLDRREHTHRAWRDDKSRWTCHLKPAFGHLRPSEVDHAAIRRFVEAKLREGLNPATVGHAVRLLSTFYSDLVERPRETGVSANPCRTLPRSTRRLMRPTWDPKDTPYLTLGDVRQVYQALRVDHETTAAAFAVAAFTGVRVGETLALTWERVDLDGRRIRVAEQVQESALGPVKDDESRTVPIQDALLPVLTAWKLHTGGEGLLFKPEQPGRRAGRGTGTPSTFVRPLTLHKHLREALKDCNLPTDLTWYQCTKHSYASAWVLNGGSLEHLAATLGHSSTQVTHRYAHLKPDHLPAADRKLLAVDLTQGPAEVVSITPEGPETGAVGQRMARGANAAEAQEAVSR